MDQVIIAREALKLSAYDRALLADSLIKSLDDEAAREIEAAWAQEAEKRLNAYESGEIQSVDGPAVISELRERPNK